MKPGYLPTEPLARAVRAWAEVHPAQQHREAGLMLLARRCAWDSSMSLIAAQGAISRIVSGEQETVTRRTADRVCVAMGRHPAEVYGVDWLRSIAVVSS